MLWNLSDTDHTSELTSFSVTLDGGTHTYGNGAVDTEHNFSWNFGVSWNGHMIKTGSGYGTKAEAKVWAEHWIGEILAGRVEPPWLLERARNDLAMRINEARRKRGASRL